MIDFHLGFAARLAGASRAGTRMGKSLDNAIGRSIASIESLMKSEER
jgi:hypothetical protein